MVEKYLTTPRHIEVQVFADKFGNAVHLFERDCSVQRRHQKIIEEAPAPDLSPALQQEFGEKAVAAAKAVNYVGAGTVEFIMDNETGNFYFMEMNTRLQVEHPVTEMVTNVDLVQWQLEVAAGNPLPLKQEEIKLDGHAFEARIYAENPENNFLPDVGPLIHLSTPEPSSDIRVETGVLQGDQVSVHYDPMIAKLVVKGKDRTEALRVLRKALQEYQIVGLNTNIDFLTRLSSHPEFISGNVETGFINKYYDELFPKHEPVKPEVPVLACLGLYLRHASIPNSHNKDPFSPWDSKDAFRFNLASTTQFKFESGEKTPLNVTMTYGKNDQFDFIVDHPQYAEPIHVKNVRLVDHQQGDNKVVAEINERLYKTTVVIPNEEQVQVFTDSGKVVMKLSPPKYVQNSGDTGSVNSVKSPMPCKITQVLVKKGDQVKKDQPLVILEAMKMEHVIKAPKDGVIERVVYSKVGELVGENQTLVTFEEDK